MTKKNMAKKNNNNNKQTASKLSQEDLAIWAKVSKSVTPIEDNNAQVLLDAFMAEDQNEKSVSMAKKESSKTSKVQSMQDIQGNTKSQIQSQVQSQAQSIAKKTEAKPLMPTMEANYKKQLLRRQRDVDARIDLHNLNQAQAYTRLRIFILDAHKQGHKICLVITGKGLTRPSSIYEEPGILRRMLPQWLSSEDLRPYIISFEPAHRHHGGEGAWYVRIRRPRN